MTGLSRSPLAACCSPASAFFFAFFRIFTRSTMGLLDGWARGAGACGTEAVLAAGGGDARRVDGQCVFAEGVQQCRRGQRVDDARDAAAECMDLAHCLGAERIARPAGHTDAVLDVSRRLLLG